MVIERVGRGIAALRESFYSFPKFTSYFICGRPAISLDTAYIWDKIFFPFWPDDNKGRLFEN
jgi:hypothetical protein